MLINACTMYFLPVLFNCHSSHLLVLTVKNTICYLQYGLAVLFLVLAIDTL